MSLTVMRPKVFEPERQGVSVQRQIVVRDGFWRGEWRTVTPESWDRLVCRAGKSCAEPDATVNAITPHANSEYLRDNACRLLTIQKLYDSTEKKSCSSSFEWGDRGAVLDGSLVK